ncbi:pre-rRNA-processing protein esf1 [Actinomortierella ambigua]|uniref:Pre-rRNA-processing protein esf1 n=1 Tax=Actinomortierella ambigua TaxID=1343610 RepID=A0A9P6PZL1_9FUNG|nr:pre-rRNA-processing protein esf1 [Actinomortierella ambigua]
MVDKKNKKGGAGAKPSGAPVTDPRFAHVHRDPRFRRPQTKESKVVVDSRFSSMLKSKEFSTAPKVDKYGRKLKSGASDPQMKRFYELQKGGASEEDESENEDEDEEQGGEDEEDDEDQEEQEDSEADSDEDEDEEDENVYDPMRGMGTLAGDSSDEESDSDIDEELAAELDQEAEYDEDEEEEEEEDIPRGDETHRFACVNMDWDHIKAVDLFKVFSGFKPESGAIRSVRIFPSEFGKEHLEREEREGPPQDIFKKASKGGDEDDMEDEDDDDEEITKEKLIQQQTEEGQDEIDTEALRKYQLDRLKYYYAVVDTDSVATAKAICAACDGAEYESSANFFDLRYIPDGMDFANDIPKDECYNAPEQYKPNDFTTQVFQHSNVKLTWDEDDAERIRVTRQKFSKQDLEDMDFKAYLASSDEEESDEEEDVEATRRKYRALLAGIGKGKGSDDENDSDDEGAEGGVFGVKRDKDQEMEITFAPGLSEAASRLLEEKKERDAAARQGVKDETSIEAYKRKEKERKQRRKDARKSRETGSDDESGDSEEGGEDEAMGGDLFSSDEDERLMNDSYFAEEFAGGDMMVAAGKKGKKDGKADNKNKNKKKDNKKRTKEERLEDQRRKAELELLMEDNRESNQHFNMKEIMKAEKKKNRKNKGGKHGKEGEDLQDDFKIDTKDPRFAALHESHEFALDPTNPQFKKTKAMSELMQERQKRSSKMQEETASNLKKKKQQQQQQQQQQKNKNKNNNKSTAAQGPFQDPSLSLLVDTVKRKSAMATDSKRDGKRAKTK